MRAHALHRQRASHAQHRGLSHRIPSLIHTHTRRQNSCTPAASRSQHLTWSLKSPAWRPQARPIVACAAVEEVVLGPSTSDSLESDRQWLAMQVATWLDEEWTPLEIHTRLGQAAGAAYVQARLNGKDEVGDVLLAITTDLLAFNYHDTFTSAFEVGNKVVELLMLRMGCDVCCTSDRDRERAAQSE